jgi:hypothetical protein
LGYRYYNYPGHPTANEIANGIIMTHAELQFILAEAAERGLITGDAEGYYNAGVASSMTYYNVAVPVMHFGNPPVGPGETLAAAKQSLLLTFFHWGLHAWAIYIVVGLSIAYFSYRHGLPLTLRSALVPIIGKTRAAGWPGHTEASSCSVSATS